MRLAIMQPYFMPYIGYWQLIAAVDRMIVLDDVAFIRRGWINRNRILVGGAAHRFSLPLRQASQNRLINEIELATDTSWWQRFRLTLAQSYRRAPFYEETQAFLEPIVSDGRGPLLPFLLRSINAVAAHLDIHTPLLTSSAIDPERRSRGQQRILVLCCHAGAAEYLNLPGGRALYDPLLFRESETELRFLVPREQPYPQIGGRWSPWLSIIDLLMHLGRQATRAELARCDIETPRADQGS
ncbi:WbqC family protein [Accumulibacter sp.]|uniref:WbqC family protein n=1 Tax=Accumulibacter sp. TaxID=2053492 RepID=UPI001AD4B6AB|nr:WbqC family protein [Accumulibacter sp.]MBN8454890.1 WbqC family protein [Accumulibacter sp.]MBO3706861.1 WbqC family protein [Candidatus Accumulibacter conexus]